MIRVVSVRYLNAAPLVSHLDPTRFSVALDHPRGVAAALASGEADVGLAPVAAVLTDADLRVLPGLCIGAFGPVQSVLVLADAPPEAWTELVLDGESRTSVTLAALLHAHGRLGARPDLTITTVEPGAAPALIGGTRAALVIGDAARAIAPAHPVRVDLAELWTRWTGLPFVFAVWAARPDLDPAVAAELVAAGRAGLDARGVTWAGDDLSYLTDAIRYPLSEQALMGLRRYAALAHEAGLVGRGEVALLDPPRHAAPRPPGLDRLLAQAADGDTLAPDALARLANHASDADLRLAAHLRRVELHGERDASYVVSDDAAVTDEPVAAAETARSRGAAALRVIGVEGAPASVRAAWAKALAEADLELIDVDLTVLGPREPAWGGAAGVWTPGQGDAPRAWLASGGAARARWWIDPARPLSASLEELLTIRALSPAPIACSISLPLPAGALVEPGRQTTGTWLRGVALARLALPQVAHVAASVRTQGLDLAQVALAVGADDLGRVGYRLPSGASHATFDVDVEEAERALRVGGFHPVRRSATFAAVGEALTRLRNVRRPEERARP